MAQPEFCTTHQAVLASPSASAMATWKKLPRSSSAPPIDFGRSMRKMRASYSASSTSGVSSDASSIRGAAAARTGASERAMAIHSPRVWRSKRPPCGESVIRSRAMSETRPEPLPPIRRNGTVLRIIDFPPEPRDPEERRRRIHATFHGMYQDATHDRRDSAHPGMHRTQTVDYAIILEGEIWAVMDKGETLMKAGDVLIQRGTNHAWANRSARTARICFVLMDGKL